jgi:phenylalanyl-tRNA synthetase beta chain
MRVPLSWLREYVDVEATAEEIAERLIFSGTEVEAIERLGAPDVAGNRDHFRLGRVLDFVQHPNADRLRLCQVDVGEADPRQIVCGATNFAVGDTVAVVLPGARLPGSGERLKRARLRGEVSDGMMLSERELELSNEHAGIITLPQDVGVPGTLLADLFALSETVLVLALTSNRGDCQSIHGVAREVATAFDVELRPLPAATPPASGEGTAAERIAVVIEAPDRCRRFTARVLDGVRIGVSPLRLRQRLAAAGMRPISNAVDITNYVMLASGQPLHAYDARMIRGGRLVARLARDGELLTTLDGRTRTLDASMLVIADDVGPNGLAGIMGGELAEVADDTTTIVLEAANF